MTDLNSNNGEYEVGVADEMTAYLYLLARGVHPHLAKVLAEGRCVFYRAKKVKK